MLEIILILVTSLANHQVSLHRDYVICKESKSIACKNIVENVEAIKAPKNRKDKK